MIAISSRHGTTRRGAMGGGRGGRRMPIVAMMAGPRRWRIIFFVCVCESSESSVCEKNMPFLHGPHHLASLVGSFCHHGLAKGG
jgi:hypothetical protein